MASSSNWYDGYPCEDSWTRVDWASAAGGRTAIDPYVVWAEATNFVDLGVTPTPEMRVPVIIELDNNLTAMQFAEFVKNKDKEWPWIQTSELYLNPAPGLENTTFCTANVTREFFAELGQNAQSELRQWIKRFELGLPMKPPSATAQGVLTPAAEQELAGFLRVAAAEMAGIAEEEGVRSPIVGIIDDGLAFAHERFQQPDGTTRILYFWNQGYPKSEPLTTKVTAVPGYGLEFTKVAIDTLMKKSRSDGLVDEDLVYRKAGYLEVSRYWAHGTHVMDLACGSDPREVDASSSRIICVQIQPPSRTTRDRSSGWLAIHVLDGLRYILDRASRLAPPQTPVVVNLSFGHIAGPHDGSSMLEGAIQELIEAYSQRPLEVVVAAGNSLLSRCHAGLSLGPNDSRTLDWRVLPDDATPSFMEIWLRPEGSASPDVKIEVTTPWGDSNNTLQPVQGSYVHTWRLDGEVLGAIIHLRRVATGDREMILLAVAPTQRLGRDERVPTQSVGHDEKVAPCGTWSVQISNCGTGRVHIEAYIERDETPYGFPRRGRQSRFEDPNYERFDKFGRLKEDDARENPEQKPPESYVKRADTINSIATGARTVVVAGFRGSDKGTARYSSNGMLINAAGPTEDSITCHGVLAAGSRSGSKVAMNGTSVAAPQLTRALASRLEKSGAGMKTGRRIVDKLAADAEQNPAPVRSPRFGNGRIDARSRPKDFLRRIGHRRIR